MRRRAVPTWGVFPNKALQGGGPLIDIGKTHALDMTLWMMDNYEPEKRHRQRVLQVGHLPQAVEGNVFGPWDPETYEVEDSAFGLIKMKQLRDHLPGGRLGHQPSWSPARPPPPCAAPSVGAEIRSGMSYPQDELYYNRGHNGLLTDERKAGSGHVAYFSGAARGRRAGSQAVAGMPA